MMQIERMLRRLLPAMIAVLSAMGASAQSDSADEASRGMISYIQRPTLQIGAGAGYEVGGMHTSSLTTQTFEGYCGHLELWAPRLFDDAWGLQGRMEFQRQESLDREFVDWDRVLIRTGQRLDAEQVDLLGTFRLAMGGVVAFGPYLGYRHIGDIAIQSGGKSGSRSEYEERGEGLRAGALLLLSFPIALGADVALVPELRLRLDPIAPDFVRSWQPFNVGAGISIDYSVQKLAPLRSEPFLSSAVDIYVLDDEGSHLQEAGVHGGTLRRERHLELAPVITFDSLFPNLPSRYIRRSAPGRFSFRPDSIARLDPAVIERHLPDLIGAWLSSGTGDCRLVATVIEGESEPVARARGGSLRRYLSGTWGIDTARMAITTEPGTRREVRVETGMGKTLTLDPAWSEPRAIVPPLHIEPDIDSDAGVKVWQIRLERNGREIASQRSDAASGGEMNMRQMMSRLERDTSASPVIAELMVEDLAGATSFARDTLRFHFQGDLPMGGVAEYLLLGVSPSDELVERIVAGSGIGSHLTITPLSQGSATRNAASDLASRLGGRGVDVGLASPPDGEENVEGMRIEIIEGAVAHP